MEEKKPMWRRVGRALIGMIMFAFGLNMLVNANIGVAPWDVLALGIANHIPLTYGEVLTILSVIILTIDLLMKERIGIGTLLDTLIVGKTVDFFNWTGIVPPQETLWSGILVMVLGLFVQAIAVVIYMKAALCCGPRDALLVGLGKRLRKLPIGVVNVILLAAVLSVGWALGGPVGVGTVIAVFGQGACLQLMCRISKFEPRDVEHYGVGEMWRDYKARRAE